MNALSVAAILLLALSGCAGPIAGETSKMPSPSECPEPTRPQQATVVSEPGEHNVTAAGGTMYSSSYADFEWAWPHQGRVAVGVVAEWDIGILGEPVMQLRVEDQSGDHLFGTARGPSPLVLNFTLEAPPGDTGLRVFVEPSPDAPSAAVVKQEQVARITVSQTPPC